jgi:hypothetical protein
MLITANFVGLHFLAGGTFVHEVDCELKRILSKLRTHRLPYNWYTTVRVVVPLNYKEDR